MAKRRRPAGGTDETSACEAQIIPLARSIRSGEDRAPMASVGAGGRTIRPIDVVLLLPLIIPLVASIVLGLLGWFVAWLAIVAMLAAAIVFGDLVRAIMWRRSVQRALDRQPAG